MEGGDDKSRSLLSAYDENLMLDRYYVPIPRDGFEDADEAVGDERERFQPLRTIWVVSSFSCIVLVYVIAVVVCALLFWTENGPDHEMQMLWTATAGLPILIIAGLVEGYIRMQHRRRQSLGYLEFYRDTRKVLPFPTQAAAYGAISMVLCVAWSSREDALPTNILMSVVAVLEGVVIGGYLIFYVRRVRLHNKTETLPDAQQYLQSRLTNVVDTRWRRQDAVVDNQVEFIRCLEAQRDSLRAEVSRLRDILTETGRDSVSGTVVDDAEHLLEAGEQRLRAIRAESETLKRQSESALKLLGEKMEEIHRLQMLLDGQRKENERLRLALVEWSKQNRRLEQKLENQGKMVNSGGSSSGPPTAR